MADLSRIKRNVAKMASQNAPEEDIDGYIASEGSSVDEIRAFREVPENQTPYEPQKSSLQSGFEAVTRIPQRMAGLLPVVGGIGGEALGSTAGAVGGPGGMVAGRILGSALGTGGGALAEQKMKRAPVQTTGELLNPVMRGLGVPPIAGKLSAAVAPTKQEVMNSVGPAVVGGVLSGALEGATAVAKPLSSRIINSMVKPGANAFKYGKNPGEVGARLVRPGNSLKEYGENINSTITQKMEELKSALTSPKNVIKRINYGDVIDSIDNELKILKRTPNSKQAAIDNIQKIKDDLIALTKDESGRFKSNFTSLSPEQAVEMKRFIGDAAKWNTKDAAPGYEELLHKTYGKMRKAIETEVPETKSINNDIGSLIELSRGIPDAIARESKSMLPFAARTAFSGAAPFLAGGGPVGAIAGMGANLLLSHPMTGTRIASGLSKMGRLLPR